MEGFASADLHAEDGEKVRARLRQFDAMLDARESRHEQIGVAVDVVSRGDCCFAQPCARLTVDPFAERDDSLIDDKRAIESIDRRD